MALTISTPESGILEYNDLTPLWTVSQLKDRIAQQTLIPVSKQKLVTSQDVVLKNALTLYESGIKNFEQLVLTFKGRGGKK